MPASGCPGNKASPSPGFLIDCLCGFGVPETVFLLILRHLCKVCFEVLIMSHAVYLQSLWHGDISGSRASSSHLMNLLCAKKSQLRNALHLTSSSSLPAGGCSRTRVSDYGSRLKGFVVGRAVAHHSPAAPWSYQVSPQW